MPRDAGTPQLRAHRARLVGHAHSDDPRAADPLGILSMAGVLTPEQVDAGWRYAVLRWQLFGSPHPDTRLYQRYLGGIVGVAGETPSLGERAERRLRAIYEGADRELRDAGGLAWREVRRVAVEQSLPDWFWRSRLAQPVLGDDVLCQALQTGLSALAAYWQAARPENQTTRSRRGGVHN